VFPEQLRQVAARAGIAAAVLGVPADLFHFTMETRASASQTLAFQLHGIALIVAFSLSLIALAGIVIAQNGRAGRLGEVGALLALLGTTFVIGDLAKETFGLPLAPAALDEPRGYYLLVVIVSFSLLALGWLLTAVAARRAGVATGGSTALLIAGALLVLPPIPGAYIVLLLGIAVSAARAAAVPERELAPAGATA
jgi:hypothetical protein